MFCYPCYLPQTYCALLTFAFSLNTINRFQIFLRRATWLQQLSLKESLTNNKNKKMLKMAKVFWNWGCGHFIPFVLKFILFRGFSVQRFWEIIAIIRAFIKISLLQVKKEEPIISHFYVWCNGSIVSNLSVCSYHITYAFQSESTLYSCLKNGKWFECSIMN